ncbi:MAG: cytochrome c biogenesis protein ResB [Candidatus Omnitrophica bacterium]|nr:cytochrome c biogenesis protein ResB [Candidatus Omnitrophota bacterium]
MAISLLVAIAAVLAWGTFYEVRFGTAAVQRFIYQSWWFQSLLGFLGLNLAVAALQRYPWKRKHLPFVLAHVGILLVLAGAIVGGKFGIEGSLVIPEGEASRTLQIPVNVLAVHQPNPGVYREFRTRFETTAWNHRPHALFTVPSHEGVLQIVVDRYHPNAVLEEEITDRGTADNPAVQISVHRGGQEQSLWLFARDPNRFWASSAQAHLLFLEPNSRAHLDQLLGRSKRKLLVNAIAIVRSPSGGLSAVLTGLGADRRVIEPLQVGQSYLHPGLELAFEVSAYYPRAQVEQKFVNRDNEVKAEAIHLTAMSQGEVAAAWVALRDSVELTLKGKPLRIEYRPAVRELPFSVKLLDFRKIDYPGTQMAAGFESDVELSDPARGLVLKRKISMNNPLKHRGYSLFQSSYFEGPVETTVLAVRNDPGTPFVYAGFLVIIAGVTTMFVRRREP